MKNYNNQPHPNLVSNWKIKTQAKIGEFLMKIVEENPHKNKGISISGIVAIAKKNHI